jgi:hypothetical protein
MLTGSASTSSGSAIEPRQGRADLQFAAVHILPLTPQTMYLVFGTGVIDLPEGHQPFRPKATVASAPADHYVICEQTDTPGVLPSLTT